MAHTLAHILHCESAPDTWKKLENVFEWQSLVSVHLLQQQFFKAKFVGSLIELVLNIEHLTSKIKQQSVEIPDAMLITKILMSLPNK